MGDSSSTVTKSNLSLHPGSCPKMEQLSATRSLKRAGRCRLSGCTDQRRMDWQGPRRFCAEGARRRVLGSQHSKSSSHIPKLVARSICKRTPSGLFPTIHGNPPKPQCPSAPGDGDAALGNQSTARWDGQRDSGLWIGTPACDTAIRWRGWPLQSFAVLSMYRPPSFAAVGHGLPCLIRRLSAI